MLTARQRVELGLRGSLPSPAYRVLRGGYDGMRTIARRHPGRGRVLPDFLIVGAPKSGTTSLYDWVMRHPFAAPAARKEVHFFDYGSFRGEHWYRSHFPPESQRRAFAREHGRPFLTGEASPTYLAHAWAPARIAELLPQAKLIVVLRDPVDRAYSQFQMSRREGEEELESFEDAVAREDDRLAPELERSLADPLYNSWPLGCWSYLTRSRYAEQIERWLPLFAREQFLFLKAEELLAAPGRTLAAVYEFLGLPPHEHADLPLLHTAEYDPLSPEVRARVADYFRLHNARLRELLGADFGWDS